MLTATVSLVLTGCTFQAEVCNEGDANVGAGARVRFFSNDDESEIVCDNAPVETSQVLSPGECEQLFCAYSAADGQTLDVRVCVDNDNYECSGGSGANNECDEGNNSDNADGTFDCNVVE